MNPLLIYCHRFSSHDDESKREPKFLPEDKGMIVPDQSPNNPKLYDSHGYMQSDVSLLFAAVEHDDLPLQKALSDRLLSSVDNSYLDESLNEDQMFDSTPSRYVQTPSEVSVQAEQISHIIDVEPLSPPLESASDDSISSEGNENSES